MSFRPSFPPLPSKYSTLSFDRDSPPSGAQTPSKEFGSTAYLADNAYALDDLSFEPTPHRPTAQASSKHYGASWWPLTSSAPGERSPWLRPRVLAGLLSSLLAVIVLAIALPLALRHQSQASQRAAAGSSGADASTTSVEPSTSSSPAAAASSAAATPLTAAQEFALIADRRRAGFAQGIDAWQSHAVPGWIGSQNTDGSWPDVDYTSGCDARRANWPAQEHLQRSLALAAMASGLGTDATAPTTTAQVNSSAISALGWWFRNDFGSNQDCIARGGDSSHGCGCGTRGLWNPNWFGQGILVPRLVSSICLLLYDDLTAAQHGSCDQIVRRAYNLDAKVIPGLGPQTGANLINVMQNFVSLALYTGDDGLLKDVLGRAMEAVTFSDEVQQDGIHRDGSFLQHEGILYSGNYGKDELLAFIELEGQTTGTSYAASDDARAAFATDIRGSEWMIHGDMETKTEFWDLHAIGRFISFPTSELTASSDINVNMTKLAAATAAFTGDNDLSDTVARLSSNATMTSANVGGLNGNKGFWASDYMVHRRDAYVQAVKLLSTRSLNTEAINEANPYGFHMGIGSLFTYATGSEYRDIQAAWDWNLIPGTTTLLDRPTLDTESAQLRGVKNFVGVVSDGWEGMAVMDFAGAADRPQISYRKAVFFLDDVVLVTTSNLNVRSDVSSTPVVAVLDNRRLSADGVVLVGDAQQTVPASDATAESSTLWHDNTGYLSYSTPFALTYSAGDRSGNWSSISFSPTGESTVSLFSAYTTVPRDAPYTYAIFPASPRTRVQDEAVDPTFTPIDLGSDISAVVGAGRLSIVFWTGGQTARVPLAALEWPLVDGSDDTLVFTSDQPAGFLLSLESSQEAVSITFADPTQVLPTLDFSIRIDGPGRGFACGSASECSAADGVATFSSALPISGFAGQSVIKTIDLF